MNMKSIKISGKGQIAIPSEMRAAMGLKKGDTILAIQEGNKLLLEKADAAGDKFHDEFSFMLKASENTAKKLWDNKEDEIWKNSAEKQNKS